MSLNWVDAIILGIVVISALMSLSRGFVKEALSLVTWVIAAIVAWMFGGSLAHHLSPYIDTPSIRVIAACAVLFVTTLIVGGLVNFILGQLTWLQIILHRQRSAEHTSELQSRTGI